MTLEELARIGAPRVRNLEWKQAGGDIKKGEGFSAWGDLSVGPTTTYLVRDGWWLSVDHKTYPTLEAAKAAAQADYERRILSALEPQDTTIAAALIEAREVLRGILEPFEGDDCHHDHHGYCQAHFLQPGDECCVKVARAFLAKLDGIAEGGE